MPISQHRRLLLAWFDQAQRPMPWRAIHPERSQPYFVLVSELMLQQTQVSTVIPYFARFISAFPTLTKLAQANEQQVLRLWQGLGYYRRAKNLHKLAQVVVRDLGGQLPETAEKLQELPGIGPYTAGAIASIAFNENAPLVDGNVIRVLARLFGLDVAADSKEGKQQIWQWAGEFALDARPGCVNQALMELGALVCTPKNTQCEVCPLRKKCVAFKENKVAQLPVLAARKKPTVVTHQVIAAMKGDTFLFVQRPETGLWSKMWQLPTLEEERGADTLVRKKKKSLSKSPDADKSVRAPLTWFTQTYGLKLSALEKVGKFKHQTTHRTIMFEVWQAQVVGGKLPAKAGIWRKKNAVDDLPLAKAQEKVLEMLA